MKNLKRVFTSILMILVCFVAIACSKSNSVATETSAVVPENVPEVKQFIVGFDAEYPPYGYLAEDGKSYEGFDLDLAREFCARNNYQFVAQPIDWDSKDLELNSGNIDCIWNGFTYTGRENDYTWTFPYVDNSIVLVVNADSGINSKADLAGKIVMAQAGSSAVTALEEEKNAEFKNSFKSFEQCADYNTAFMNLESGIIDCIAVDIGVAKYKLNSNNGMFKQLEENVSTEQYAIGFKKGNTKLRDEVEKTLSEMWKDGTFENIAKKYSDFSLPDMICLGQYVK